MIVRAQFRKHSVWTSALCNLSWVCTSRSQLRDKTPHCEAHTCPVWLRKTRLGKRAIAERSMLLPCITLPLPNLWRSGVPPWTAILNAGLILRKLADKESPAHLQCCTVTSQSSSSQVRPKLKIGHSLYPPLMRTYVHIAFSPCIVQTSWVLRPAFSISQIARWVFPFIIQKTSQRNV